MRRLPLFFVPLLLAACSGAPTGPDDDLVPITSPTQFWEGTARYKRTLTVSAQNPVITEFEGNVRWQTTDSGPAPWGYTVVSGTMVLTHRIEHRGEAGCFSSARREFTLGPGDGSFIIFPGSRVSGRIRKTVTFTTTTSCPGGGSYDYEDDADMDLLIEGSRGERISGTMAPTPTADSRIEGSWDFTPR